jgi:autotransporter-associated beta strand protein
VVRSILATAAAVTCAGLLSSSLHAQTWNQPGGSHAWDDPENWSPNEIPNAVGAVANVNNDITSDQTITVPGSTITLGVLNIGDSGEPPASRFTIGTPGAGTLIFDNGASDAQINASKVLPGVTINDDDIIGANILLNSNLVVNAGPAAGDVLRINGFIGDGFNGPRGLTKNGDGWLELGQTGIGNTYTGLTVLNGGRLRLASGGNFVLLPGDIEIGAGATLQDANGNGHAIADTAVIRFVGAGFYNPGGGSDVIGGIEGVGEDVYDAQPGGGSGMITFGGTNADYVFEGRFVSSTNWTKVGTGVQTIGGGLPSLTTSGSNVDTNRFQVYGGRMDLGKVDGAASIANRNLIIGDGSLSGESRPEVRLLANEQINVSFTVSGVLNVQETTRVTLNSGILNLNGHTETVGALRAISSSPSTIDLGDGGSLVVVGDLTIEGFARAEVKTGPGGTVTVGGLVMDGPDRWLDLTTSTLTVQNGDLSQVNALVASGYAGGNWNGDGISSSAAAAASDRSLGIGQDGSDVVVKYTYSGDATLDGAVTIADLGVLAANWQGSGKYWFEGDFNYDGDVNIADLGILAGNWQKGTGGGMSFEEALAMFDVFNGVVIPEPASVGLLSVMGFGLLARRQRRLA